MIRINEHYTKLKASYLFADIAKRVNAFVAANPSKPVIRLGIGDVTEPLPPVCVEALQTATNEMAQRATFKGYGPEQGYAFLREAVVKHEFAPRGCHVEADEVFISDGSKCDCGNIQEIFSQDLRLAIPDPVYPVYVDTNVMAGRTGPNADGRYAGITYLDSTPANGYVPAIPSTPADLIYLSAVQGWKECKTKICFIVEFYSGLVDEYAYHLSLLKDFDHVVLCFSGSVQAVEKAVGRPCHHVPLGVDVFRFSPYPNPPVRCLDVYSMGRRIETAHEALLSIANRKGIFYIYDTLPGVLVQPRDHRQHRDLIANCAKRARFFVTYPAKVDAADETRGQSEVGARFFEGAAAGAVLIGQAPTTPAFAKDFGWRDAVVNIGTSEESVISALAGFRAEPERAEALGRSNAVEALRRFDWGYRWSELLRLAKLEPTPRLRERQQRLHHLAALAEYTPVMI